MSENSTDGNAITPHEKVSKKDNLKNAWEYIKAYFIDVIDLEKGVDKQGTIEEIRTKKSMGGANAWMLMCSIVIASIGLSQNSQAVIIGAMLISPLMAPILGIGLSVGINDMSTLRVSLIHFGAAIFIAILTSTVYFYIFDIPEITSEIQSRTNPTFLDIFVAIFGGVAGIISIARKDISVTLPGVAIATALMPPLCVTGYGLATANWEIASKSFYLFFLNTFFVTFATYVIVRFLRFPYTQYLVKTLRRRNKILIVAFSLILIIPSIWIFFGVIDDTQKQAAINKFAKTCLGDKQKYLDSYQLYEYEGGREVLYLKCYGDQISPADLPIYEECLTNYHHKMKDVKIEILSSSEVNLDEFTGLQQNIKDLDDQLKAVKAIKEEQAMMLAKTSVNPLDSAQLVDLNDELRILYPNIEEVGIGRITTFSDDQSKVDLPIIQVSWSDRADKSDRAKMPQLRSFVQERLDLDTLVSYQ